MSKTEETSAPTEAEVAAKRKALLAELDALPAPVVPGSRPGSVVGTGFAAERVPFTKEFYLDVEARKKEPEFGPDYRLHPVNSNETLDISVNGVSFRVYAGLECKLPTPHYMVYRDRLDRLRAAQAQFEVPEGQSPKPMTVYRIDGPWKKQDITAE